MTVTTATWSGISAVAVAATLSGAAAALQGSPPDPFAFFAPTIRLTPAQRASLDAGGAVVRALPGDDGHLGVFMAARLDAGPDSLIAWSRRTDALVHSPLVISAGRFSDPPVDSDMEGLTLDDHVLDALKACRPRDCDVKLAAAEIDNVRAAVLAAGPGWRDAAAHAFRRILIGRIVAHRTGGLPALPPDADHERTVSRYEAFASIVTRSPYLAAGLPHLVSALETPAHTAIPGSESLYYWSKERYGAGKAVISVTHVRFWKPDTAGAPAAVAASTQIVASHYVEASLVLTTVLCETADGPCYLAYINRTRVDLFGGLLGGIKRSIVRQRMESHGPELIRAFRNRLQTAAPLP